MKDEKNLNNSETQTLNIPVVVRWLIMAVCCILIAIIWLIQIPWSLLVTLPTGYFLHEFDIIMQPYYWFEMARRNDFDF